MIYPHPESNFSINLMVLGADIIKFLKSKEDFVLTENVLTSFLSKDDKRTPDMFVNALSFLYAMGIVERKGYKIKLLVRNRAMQTELF